MTRTTRNDFSIFKSGERKGRIDAGSTTVQISDNSANILPKGSMNLDGLAVIVSKLRAERTNLLNQLNHIDAALSVLGKLNDGIVQTAPRRSVSASARRKINRLWEQDLNSGGRLRTLEELERHYILRVLRKEGGHVESAARTLGIPRSSLYYKLKHEKNLGVNAR